MCTKSTTTRLAAAVAGALLLSVGSTAPASATLLDMTPTGQVWNTTAVADTTFAGRGIYIRADENVSVDSIGWFGNLNRAGGHEIAIYLGQGEVAALGALQTVGAANFVAGGGAPIWNDIAMNFTFLAGTDYYVNFRRTDGTSDFADPFHFISWGNGAELSDIGVVTLLDGRDGFAPDFDNNSWFTHFRMNIVDVPEPGTLALFGLGLAGLGFARRRRAASRQL